MDFDRTMRKLAGNPGLVIAVGSFLGIAIITLYPFNFSVQEDSLWHQLVGSLQRPSNLVDQIANVLLFIPWGFGLGWHIRKKTRLTGAITLVSVLIFSFGFSLSIELLQTFLPTRTSSLSDVLTNTLGGVFGCLSFYWWVGGIDRKVYWICQKSLSRLTIKPLAIGFIGYFLLVSLIILGSQNLVNLNRWDVNFPLLLGNEQTGDRPWKGTISEVAIANKAITGKALVQLLKAKKAADVLGDSLLAEYLLEGKGNYSDLMGRSPNLVWRGSSEGSTVRSGVSLSPQHWLTTLDPAKFINQQIQKSSEFTLSLIAASSDQAQTGPARIFSLSQDALNRNLTIGQEGQDLTVRLRTSFSGDNGRHPEMYFGNIFKDTAVHHFVIVYANAILRVYVDNSQRLQTSELSPDATLLSYLLPPKIHQGKIVEIVHSLMIFVPLAFLLALISTLVKGNLLFYCLLMMGGSLVPAILLEMLWCNQSAQSLRVENLMINIFISLITFWATRLLIRWAFLDTTKNSVEKADSF
ncbi:VanZ family protein [Kovacikia minuta CCNUW1]|uniref:VanZ family protein n=1 Tax=Kovacikia minuta TaxID=2931930 RepID=UPI001CCC5F03|nr:VanZ family protein [Kovacikia minuta]UBF27318.1 VanZ family protein [Kovacikia minuta CCNUW1]